MHVPLELTARAEATHFWFRGFRQFLMPVLRDLSAARQDLRIIDCGSGIGHNMLWLRRYGRVVGFDISQTGTERTRAAGGTVVRADAARAPFVSEAFDIATSFDVLPFVESDVTAVREMARMVCAGGAVVLTMAALESLRGDHSRSWGELRRYTPAMARRVLEEAGLRVERVSFMFGSLFPLMLTVRMVQRLLRPFREFRHDRDIAIPWAPANALLTAIVTAEARVARRFPLPIGSSLLAVGRKP